ncbi:caspase family protein [Streptomyces sp. NBC_00572]|uniref:caspase family protein n=1 Tax=Streptomyces sp. NBC_00572 TaxID=2903664 RepID=UPI00225BF06B|nr:caspase family protein [Streptomyces sp. NBC_00572]MCX4986516.1 caspase family protein [Streptomyces sp. NBC_00572]
MTGTYEDSWALVVGIDAYDHPDINDLGGAVQDACQSVEWLRKAGVPDQRILLHAQPTETSRPLLTSLDPVVPWENATEADITKSLEKLREVHGSHLFVFLSGHGIYDPATKRLFVTCEASPKEKGVFHNLGIEEHIELFRSMDFPEQLLIMDGCQNVPFTESERSRVVAGMPFSGFNAKAGNTLVFCFACQQSEMAMEIEGRGLFLKKLLKIIDTQNPTPRTLHLDFDSGDVSIDLRRAVTEVVGPEVAETAWTKRIRQTPGVQVYGAGTAQNVWPLHLPPTPAARMSISVTPASAAKDVREILVRVDDAPYWRREAPVPPRTTVELPFENHLPHETSLSVTCRLKDNSGWRKPAERRIHIGDSDSEIVFKLKPDPPGSPPDSPPEGRLRGRRWSLPPRPDTYRSSRKPMDDDTAWVFVGNVDSSGSLTSSTSHELRGSIRKYLRNPPNRIEVTEEEGGLYISGRYGDRELLMQFASEVATTFASVTPDDISTTIRESSEFPDRTAVRVVLPEGGTGQLVGAVTDTPTVTVGQTERAIREIEADPLFSVSPGHVQVRVDLPWGSWSEMVEVFAGTEKTVPLPRTIGNSLAPLRVIIQPEVWEELPGYSVIDLDRRTGKWLITTYPKESAWGTCVSLPGTGTGVTFPLHPSLPLALDISDRATRVEPLSTIPTPEWDALVSLGNLSGHNPKRLFTADKTWAPDPALTLARAYACYAAGEDKYTRGLLKLLSERGSDICDMAVLEGATALRSNASAPKSVRADLERWADAGTVPVLRWGVAPAVVLAQKLGLDGWRARLEAIEESLSPVSTWTVWTVRQTP